ncbi:MarR family transcriptional regulator [Actinoplanes palleronii]|uniref:MarR family transcriptional regulator n=1 Tax=Actinoplanes palleronii TaxID=113570 RepID=A0ABQ4BH31_9ACTN|nr:MarR family transcriptional regulator [Actinoplanes palleronii]GIE69959.1 MarR family transcriptional regulator [Actinoplanes palleronii]
MIAVRALVTEAVALRRTLSRRSGLTETELDALDHLVESPSTPSELARLLDVSTAASTGVVDRLERRGHVERRKHPTDRRRLEIHVTDDGRAELLRHLTPMLHALTELDQRMTPDERETVIRFLSGAQAAFRAVEGS